MGGSGVSGPLNVLPAAPIGPPRYALPFVGRETISPTSSAFRFSTRGTSFSYRSNQAVRVQLPASGDPRPWRLFSLSSSPTERDEIAFTVKMTGSPFKEALRALVPGERVTIAGPIGDLLYDPSRPAVFVAGGIGVTPFRGMMRYAADTTVRQPIRLLYSARTPDEFAFRDELDAIVAKNPSFRVEYTVTRPEAAAGPWAGRTGRIDTPLLRTTLDELDRPKVYVVGLPGMAREMLYRLKNELGVSEDDLEYEYFVGF